MELETKHILALIVLVGVGSAGMFATLMSQRMRDVALFLFIIGAVLIEKMNVTFLGQFWYRGTSRGIEVAAIDLIPLCLLFSNLLLPRYVRGRFFWPAGLGMLLAYLAYCVGSVVYSEPRLYGTWELAKIMRGILVLLAAAMFIRTRRELGVVVLALGFTASMEALTALDQRFFKGTFRAAGTLDHENTLSTYLCTIAPVLVAAAMANWSRWLRWFAGLSWVLAAGGEILTLSRLGIPVFAIVSAATALACAAWTLTRRKVVLALLVAGLVGVFVHFSWDGLRARYTQGSIRAEFTDMKGFETRGVYWRLAFEMLRDHPCGVGLNNWSYYVGKTYGAKLGYGYSDYDDIKWVPTKDDVRQTLLPPAADTLPALTLGELGIAGLAIFLLMWLRWLQMGAVFLRERLNDDPMHRLGIGVLFGVFGVFLQSTTEWTYRQAPVMFTCHLLVGLLAGLYHERSRIKAARTVPATSEELDIGVVPVSVARVTK